LGLTDVILWLSLLGLSKGFIELDYKLVVDNIVHNSNNQYEFGSIMATCKAMLQLFLNLKISFVKRQANYVTHSLTRVSNLYVRHQIFDLILSFITITLMNEII